MGDDERSAEALCSSAPTQLTHDGVQCSIYTVSVDEAQPLFYSWAAREGWNPAAIDPRLWAAIDDRAFHVLYRHTPSEPICILATLVIDDSHAFLGPFITAAAYQRRGFGSLLFEWGMRRLDPTRRCVGLDSTLEQQRSYQRRGFTHTAAEEWRYAGIVTLAGSENSDGAEVRTEVEVVSAAHSGRVELEQLCALYEQCVESSLFSPHFCHTLLTSPGSITLAALSPASTHPTSTPTAVCGLVIARRAGRGYRVGPLFARSSHVACVLLQRLQAEMGVGSEDECGMHIDVPSSHTAAVELMERLSLKRIFASVRMYTRPPRLVPHCMVFGSEPCP